MQSMYRIALGDNYGERWNSMAPIYLSLNPNQGFVYNNHDANTFPPYSSGTAHSYAVQSLVPFSFGPIVCRDGIENAGLRGCSLYSLRASPFPNSSLGFMTRRIRHILGPPLNDVPFYNCTLQWETVRLHNLEMLGNIPSQALFPSLSAATGSLDC